MLRQQPPPPQTSLSNDHERQQQSYTTGTVDSSATLQTPSQFGNWPPSSQQQQQAATAVVAGAATAALEASVKPHVATVMSTIGFGIDLGQSGHSSWDATEASVRAIRDAMERSTLRLPFLTSTLSHGVKLQMHVKLGVPPKKTSLTVQPMVVDLAAVTQVLPSTVPLVPIKIVVGGLSVPGIGSEEPPICAVVASITIQAVSENESMASAAAAQRAMEQGPWAAQLNREQHPQEKRPALQQVGPLPPNASSSATRRVASMDMLARISEAVRENPRIVEGRCPQQYASSPLAAAVAVAREYEAVSSGSDPNDDSMTVDDDDEKDDDDTSSDSSAQDQSSSNKKRARDHSLTSRDERSKRKLPPGLTRLKNERQYVKHDYIDHAIDEPLPGEDVHGPIGESIPFPFRMHDILTSIDTDGLSHVMSWMPHGRSFKIHDLEGFHRQILTRYFRHTKKSSLLRQLNLYGFNRICAGPDKGSYYHMYFLRGKRFLCHRMRRNKVNGKRIRSAGNPDKEPSFQMMDPLPLVGEFPVHIASKNMPTVSSDVSEDEDLADEDDGDAPEGPKTIPQSYESMSFPFKLQAMLDQLEALGQRPDVISWQPHGRSFRVHKPETFSDDLMKAYFGMGKFSSFIRQLHIYGFIRITSGPDRNAYYHPKFHRGNPRLVLDMKRIRINGNGCRKPADPSSEPDFYNGEMPPVPAIPFGLKLKWPENMPLPPPPQSSLASHQPQAREKVQEGVAAILARYAQP